MPIILREASEKKAGSEFRNPLITYLDFKSINLDRTLVNLYALLDNNGGRLKLRAGDANKGLLKIENLLSHLRQAEENGYARGMAEHETAVRGWLRANLADLVLRGQGPTKEVFATLRPNHLLSYRVRNQKHTRDYNSSDQVYSLLSVEPDLRQELRNFLKEGWDEQMDQVRADPTLDVDSLGLLRLVQDSPKPVVGSAGADFKDNPPLLLEEAKRYCRDVRRLLQYRHLIPRHVLLDYLKILTGFHLSLYVLALVRYVPELVRTGSLPEKRPLNLIVDLTDDLTSPMRTLAMDSAATYYNYLPDYIRSVFAVNQALAALPLNQKQKPGREKLALALQMLQTRDSKLEAHCNHRLDLTREKTSEDMQGQLSELIDMESDSLDAYLSVFMYVRGSWYNRYHVDLLDSLMMKNSDSGLLAAGRSRKNTRRFVVGPRLLELLVQLMVLKPIAGGYTTEPLSIEDFMSRLYEEYGLIVNGLGLAQYEEADLTTHQAFAQNVSALKDKLRQVGFYTQLSDAYLLQKIQPRYKMEVA